MYSAVLVGERVTSDEGQVRRERDVESTYTLSFSVQ